MQQEGWDGRWQQKGRVRGCSSHPLPSRVILPSVSFLHSRQDEASRMTFIFPDPKPAMELLMQRMFEERIKPVVEL